ncbi:putative membrane protein [Weissella oryzae SG25]|uniref:Putative membrane protein n=1 Tax=Weissella oryzae (strain DSM 25784 / JCM 18191 / LMG 30913 / SG25) TaxID=1329250 RepID=A0A069CSH3_WEIOS|nr:DUF368 domain-containing protein [Weissella oryzae]GAK30198.1 putative membrane protein [Weissella oryzae SG25]
MKKENNTFWILQMFKGAMIGSGFILPGISGGALAAVFGMYERIIQFLANPFKNLKANFRYFWPVALGALLGIFGLSFAISFFLGNYERIALWFFIGAILGTLPALWRQAGRYGHKPIDIGILSISLLAMLAFLIFGAPLFSKMEPSFAAWLLAGALIGLGLIIPGLSPSNFLLYLGLYKGMSDGIKHVEISVLLPIMLGLMVVLLLLSKLMALIFQHWHAELFHFIFGVVIASTIMIVPTNYQNFGLFDFIWSITLLIFGIGLGYWMSKLEMKVKA